MAEIDLSAKLGREKKTIRLSEDKVFEVNDDAETYLLVQEKFKTGEFSIQSMYDMIEVLMGQEALDYIKSMKLNIHGLEKIIIAISAIIDEVEYEEMEKRFQKSK